MLEGVKQLPDDRREALIMRFALGMDNREIARALGRTDGATKVLIHRAIRQLEESSWPMGGEGSDRRRLATRAAARACARAGRSARDLVDARLRGDAVESPSMPPRSSSAGSSSAMRDPRNWVRPAAALVVGTAAGAALVVLRVHQRHRTRGSGPG